MNWEAIGAIGEILGAIAVVATLFYLAKQISAQTNEARLTALHEMAAGFREASIVFTDGAMADIASRANDSIDDLTDSEVLRLFAGFNPVIRVFEEAYEQYLERDRDPGILGIIERYTYLFAMPALAHVWEQRRQHYLPAFGEFVDGLALEEFKTR